jgi:uncharacterized protein (TIGR03790 family)
MARSRHCGKPGAGSAKRSSVPYIGQSMSLTSLVHRAVVMLGGVLILGCQAPPPTGKLAPRTGAQRTVVVINRRSPASDSVGRYYATQRGLDSSHVLLIDVPVADEIGDIALRTDILSPVRRAIDALPHRIDFIVLTKGVPLRVARKNGYSVDALLAGMHLTIPPMVGLDTTWLRRYRNPYFNAQQPFNSERYGMYLVTRLDCTRTTDCLALVDRATQARPVQGPFFFDALPPRAANDGYALMNRHLYAANFLVRLLGYDARIDSSAAFVPSAEPVMGYVSWGSNDARFDSSAYHAMRFLPGALAETFVSTSARTFGPVTGGQSRITDLIAQGVTGVKGYVSEPYTLALARPEILFDRYLRGATLAEAFYAASPMVLWKDVVIGDPLCAPYALQLSSAYGVHQ